MNSLSLRFTCFLSDKGIKSTGGLLQELKDIEESLQKIRHIVENTIDHPDETWEEIAKVLGIEAPV